MNILLTNDDGYEAPGLAALHEAVREFGDVLVAAPSSEKSACSHTITLRSTLRVERREHDRFGKSYAVDGTPADCVRLAHVALFDEHINLVVSGINFGANAGVDTFYSGTVAGAREGAILGHRSIAVSQALRRGIETDWTKATAVTKQIIAGLMKEDLPGPGFWSINLPAPIPDNPMSHVHRVPVAVHPMPMTFDETRKQPESDIMEFDYGASYWLRDVTGPSDYSIIRDGGIAVTAIPLVGKF